MEPLRGLEFSGSLMGNSSSWKRTRRPDDQTALMSMQLQIARCADLLARTDRVKPPRTLADTMRLWMRAEVAVLEAIQP